MTLRIYNTASRNKENFEPINEDRVTMYVCGPTVYNFVHIGNARPVVVFDTLFRVLKSLYHEVIYARNITDIDDKIMKVAVDTNSTIEEVSQKYAEEYKKDMAQLNNLEPSVVPYATDHIGQMIAMVQSLIDKGHAYEAEGHVLFSVQSMEDYGALSNRSLEDMLDGARVEVAPYKRYGGDFVLWKPSSEDEPWWDSPWGRGRPGWHLECSAMIEKLFGNTIDIHGGGRDLVFPHHENERAQSQCAHGGEQYVKYWMHNGFINIDGEKMSKSLGNFKTVRELLSKYNGEAIRYALLSGQYRSELEFSADLLEQAKSSLDSLYGALKNATADDDTRISGDSLNQSKAYHALLDDLNTPLALSEVHQLAKELNKNPDNREVQAELMTIADLMGLLQADPEVWFQGEEDTTWVDELIKERDQAKKEKNYGRADEIRTELKEKGILLLDSKEGTTWRKE